MNPGECSEITTGYKIPIKQIIAQDTIFHPVSYATEHNPQVHSRWIEIPSIKQIERKNITQQVKILQHKAKFQFTLYVPERKIKNRKGELKWQKTHR